MAKQFIVSNGKFVVVPNKGIVIVNHGGQWEPPQKEEQKLTVTQAFNAKKVNKSLEVD